MKLLHHAPSDGDFTQGETYEIIRQFVDFEGDEVYAVMDNDGCVQTFTVDESESGVSYRDWFYIVEN
jgi:hypothetical protein